MAQICNSKILICEYIKHFNYLNTARTADINLYQLYNSFNKVICLPNWQDICIYANEIITYNHKADFKKYLQKTISFEELRSIIKNTQTNELERYYSIIKKSDLPELLPFVQDNIFKIRLAYTINHPTNELFLHMYKLIIMKYFGHDVPYSVLKINEHKVLADPYHDTKLTFYDKHCLDIVINEVYLDVTYSNVYLSQ
jgi:hypothetical protein